MNKIRSIIRNNKFEVTIFSIFSISYCLYCMIYLFVEYMYLAWFYGDIQLVGKFLDNTLAISDLFRRFGEHGMLGYNILLLINTRLFHLQSRFDVVVNCINVIISGLFIIIAFKHTIKKDTWLYKFAYILMCFVLFSILQGSSTSMETQVRLGLLFFVISVYYIDLMLIHNEKKYLIISILLILVSINIFGTLYNFAGIPILFLIIIIHLLKMKKIEANSIVIIFTYITSIILYCIQYGLFQLGSMSSGALLEGILFWIKHPINFMLNLFSYNGSSVLGYGILVDNRISTELYMVIGFLITMIYVYSIYAYLKSKMYRITILPVLLQGYTFFVLALALIGRYQLAGYTWGTSSWYHVHTKLGLVACIWIILFYLHNVPYKIKNKKIIVALSFSMISIGLLLGTSYDLHRAPYVKAYYENFSNQMKVSIENMPLDSNGNTPLLADKKTTAECLGILRENKLSVFSKLNKQTNSTKITSKSEFSKGMYYADGWITKEVEFEMNTGKNGNISGSVYVPSEDYLPNTFTVFINDKEIYRKKLENLGQYDFEITYEPQKDVTIKIMNDKAVVPKDLGLNEDVRSLSLILSKFYSY